MKYLSLVVVAVLGVASAAAQESPGTSIKDPWEAFRQGRADQVEAEYRPAARDGDLQAQLFLGHLAIMRGRHADAIPWYLMAARQGNPEAQALLATQYLRGEGVARDPVVAFALYDLAARQSYANAEQARDTAARQMSPNQIENAEKLVDLWGSQGLPDKLSQPPGDSTP